MKTKTKKTEKQAIVELDEMKYMGAILHPRASLQAQTQAKDMARARLVIAALELSKASK